MTELLLHSVPCSDYRIQQMISACVTTGGYRKSVPEAGVLLFVKTNTELTYVFSRC